MKTIEQKYAIKAPAKRVWRALTDPEIIKKWGGGPAKMTDKEGAGFKLWGGDIYGKNIRAVEEKELVQEWFQRGWKNPSTVTFELIGDDKTTELTLTHKDIPDSDVVDIGDGWKEYYLGPIKRYLEKG